MTDGGSLYIGVADNGEVCGVDDPDQICQSLASLVCDRIAPSIVSLLTIRTHAVGEKCIVQVDVEPGSERPYSTDPNKAQGVYIRLGATNNPALLPDLQQMVRASNPVPFESRPSPAQDLTFTAMQKYCLERQFSFDPNLHLQYGFRDPSTHFFSNLAYLCSDQAQTEIICMTFFDDKMLRPLNVRSIRGSIFELLDKASDYIAQNNVASFETPGDGSLERIEKYYVSPAVVRESLVNAIAHRDYSEPVASRISITPSNLIVSTYGGLPGLDEDAVFEGFMTRCRNEKLASLLIRLKLMEGVGAGFRQIRDAYPLQDIRDLLAIGPKRFTLKLPRVHAELAVKADDLDVRIVDFIRAKGEASRQEVQEQFSLGRTQAGAKLKALVETRRLELIGRTRNIRYRAVRPDS